MPESVMVELVLCVSAIAGSGIGQLAMTQMFLRLHPARLLLALVCTALTSVTASPSVSLCLAHMRRAVRSSCSCVQSQVVKLCIVGAEWYLQWDLSAV